MVDVATLAIQIDSRQARAAGRDLNQFQRTARTTERSAGNLSAANQNLAESFRNTAGSIAVMHGPLGGIASRFSAMGMLVGRMGIALGGLAVGIGAATFAAQRGVRAFADYERQMLTTEQVIRATGGAAGRTAEDVDTLSRQIGVSTLASAQQVREAGNMLLTFRSIAGDTFDRTLVAAQDLAAAGFGSVTSATQQLARALEDPAQGLTMLRRVGVSFSASQIEVIKNLNETGRTAEAQNQILKQVEQQVGGAGAAAGGGLAGAFDNLSEATADWFILVGENMSNLLRLPDIFNAIGNSVRGSTGDLGQSSMGEFLGQARQQIEENLALIERLGQGRQDPGTLGRIRQLEMENEAIQANIIEVERFGRVQQQVTEARSRAAQEQMRTDQFEAEMIRQERDAAELRLTELQKQIAEAQRRAGVDPLSPGDSSRAAEIERQVTANFRLAESIDAVKRADEERAKARQGIRDVIASLDDELAILRAGDPVKERMIELSRELGEADAEHARIIRDKVSAIEEETTARSGRDAIEARIKALRTDIAVMRESDPIQKQLIRNSEDLAHVTGETAAEYERLLRVREQLNRMGSHRGPLDFRQSITGIPMDFRTSMAGASGAIGTGAGGTVRSLTQDGVAKGVQTGVNPMRQDFTRAVGDGFRDMSGHSREIAGYTGRTADGVREIGPGFDRVGDRFAGAIGQQTGALTSAFGRMVAQAAAADATNTSGEFGGSAGGSQAMRFSVNVAAQSELDRLSRERNVIASQMSMKQLTPEQEERAQLRLAEIDLESAKLEQHMGEVSDAFQDLKPSLLSMVASGMEFDAVVGRINNDLKRRFGTSGVNFFSSTDIPQFADGAIGIRGPGTGTSDSITARISNGESVINERSTSRNAGALDTINRDKGRTTFDLLPRFADGDVPGTGRMPEQSRASQVNNSQQSVTDRSVNIGQIILGSDGGGGGGRGSMRQQARDLARTLGAFR